MEHESHVFYDPPREYYESYQHYETYEPYYRGNPPRFDPPRFDMYHRNVPLPHSRKYASSDSAYNFRVDGEVGSVGESNMRSYNNTTDKSRNGWHMRGGRERPYHPAGSFAWWKSRRNFDWDSRASPQNDASSPLTFTTSSDSMSGSDSGSKYKNQTNKSQDNDRWYGKKHDEQSLKAELDRKTKKIRSLYGKVEMLEKDQERRGRQLASTKKQVMSKHHKLNAAKTQIEELNHQMDLLKEQLMSVENDNMEKVQVLTEQSKQFAEAKDIYHSEVDKLKMQLRVSKQLLAQKDEYFRKNGQQFQNWNSELTQKNYQLTQKHAILEKSYQSALQTIQTLTNRNRNLQIEKEQLERTNKNLQETKREQEAQITRLMDKLSGWAVSAVSGEEEDYTQSGSESEDCEEETASANKIIPGDCVPKFIFDESKLSKEERTIKSDLRLRKQLKNSYKTIPTIPTGSVLKQIFQFGCRFVHPDFQKKSKDGLLKKSHPRPIDRKEKARSSSGEKAHPLVEEEEVEPWQLPDPELISKNVNVTVFEKLHAVDKSQDGKPEDSKQSPKGANLKN